MVLGEPCERAETNSVALHSDYGEPSFTSVKA